MITVPEINFASALTDGAIAVSNLESARQRSWSRFWRDPLRPGVAECLIEQEQMVLQFVGDCEALDRLEELIHHLDRVDADSPRTAFLHAQVASTAHRFDEARACLARIVNCPESAVEARRLSLSIDQACGTALEVVLEERQLMATQSWRLEDMVPLGALHADLRDFEKADEVYRQALREYGDTSPFPVAWVCFQLGVLWGELVAESQIVLATAWYEEAVRYLPAYVKARVHLAELYFRRGLLSDAERLLIPAVAGSDPEVSWRLADVLIASGRFAEADEHMQVARAGFENLLGKHALAFADHGAEFYAGSGNDPKRAFEFARANVANRPTLRAFERAYETAVAAGEYEESQRILAAATKTWGQTNAFRFSPLAEFHAPQSASEA